MPGAARRGAAVAGALALLLGAAAAPAGEAAPGDALGASGARLLTLAFSDLAGWAADDHAAALAAFRRGCRARAAPPAELCRRAEEAAGPEGARLFFERAFEPVEVSPAEGGRGFLTGYFEPELAGATERSEAFPAPLLARPDDLVALDGAPPPPGWPAGLAAARRTPAGGFEPYPDRAAIEGGALGAGARPLLFVADPVDAFMAQVQGSARIRLPDDRVLRVGYAGRNGHPYTAVARVLAEREGLPPSALTADKLVARLKADRALAAELLPRNRSFVFFRIVGELEDGDGPVGAAGVPLSPGRSLAVDARLHAYGSPVWIEADVPGPDGTVEPVRRLLVAQDTGTAIVGPARGDLFFGSGPEAGARAALVRHPVRFVALRPRAADR